MNAHTGKSIKIANKFVWIGIGLGMFWWFLEAFVHVFVFRDGTLLGQLLSPDQHELWMRSLVAGLLLMFSVYVQYIIKQRELAAKELKKHRNHLEELVSARITDLKKLNEQLGQEIIERKRAEGALNDSEQQKGAVLDACVDMIMQYDKDLRILWANKTAASFVNKTPEDLVGHKCHKIFQGLDSPCPRCPCLKVLETGNSENAILYHAEMDNVGESYWHNYAVPIKDESGKVNTIIEIARNVTEQKKAEEALTKKTKEKMAILNSMSELVTFQDAEHRVIWANRVAGESVGLKPEELVGRKCYEIWHHRSKPCIDCPISRVLETGQVHEGEKSTPDGLIWFLRSYPVRDENENIMGMVETRLDITESKRAAEQLRTSEERYRILAENVADGVGIIQNNKFTFTNAVLGSIFGYTGDQLVGMESTGPFRDDYKHRYKELLKAAEKNSPPNRFQAPCICENGREIWIEAGHNLIVWEGKPAVLVTIRDITEDKYREMAMKDEAEHLRRENVRLKSSMKERYRFGNIIGKSAVMQKVYDLILKASATDASVVIYGESGTGKELVARTIHEMSDRQHKAFVPVNCGAIPETLFESEFFGHRKGAFTGAHIDKHGFFDLARGGTLFLDEVGELNPNMQVKLLRAIEGGEYTSVGDTRIRKADVRIVAATNRNLMDMLRKGLIREDFIYRIHVIPVTVPPFRDRKEDMVLLVDHFLKLHGNGKKCPTMSEKILNALYNHDWPGNIRELENVLKRYLTMKRLEFIRTATDKTDSLGPVSVAGLHQEEGLGLREALEAFEKGYISKRLVQNQWHRTKTAALLGIPERTLYRKLKQFRLTSS